MKKYLVKDEDEGFSVTEIDEEPEKKTKDEDIEEEEIADESGLTDEEITALKGLAAVAGDLMSIVQKAKASDEDEEVDDEDKDFDDEDEDDDTLLDEDEEEVIETKKTCDSKKSFGAIQRKSKPKDSLEEDEVVTAWAKRYGGVK